MNHLFRFRLIVHDKEKFSKESVSELAYCLKNHVTNRMETDEAFWGKFRTKPYFIGKFVKKNIEKNLKWSN